MPIYTPVPIRCLSQAEFGDMSFEVMRHIFAIHTEFGRFFDEKIYKRELVQRMPDVCLEVPIEVTFDSFAKRYFLDVLVGEGGLFEFKTASSLNPQHRAQLIHYLLLAGLHHGKLVNMRPEKVVHEFVNTTLSLKNLRQPVIERNNWDTTLPGAALFESTLCDLIADWGMGLELPLYMEAVTHFFGGEEAVCANVAVLSNDTELGVQNMHMASPYVAFKLTAIPDRHEAFGVHAKRLLAHTHLKAILWANITHRHVNFTCIR